jgi:hypothetical protein
MMADGGSMQPDSKQSQSGSTAAQPQNTNADDEAKGRKSVVKKRTKTGCLSKFSSSDLMK